MKKTGLAVWLLCAGLGVFAQSAVVLMTSGVVEIKQTGDETFTAAKTGDPLNESTVISTGLRSFAIIEIGCATITLKPLTQLTLTSIQDFTDRETLDVNLLTGRVRVEINPPEETTASMSIVSPMASVSVHGTSFEFDTRNLYVDDGKAGFMGKRGQSIRVGPGSSSRLGINARAIDPIKIRTAGLFPPAPPGVHLVGVPYTINLEIK